MDIEDNTKNPSAEFIEEEQADLDWHKECAKKLARQILEERNLKLLVIQKEREYTEKKNQLTKAREQHLDQYSLQPNDQIAVTIDEYQKFCIQNLENRIDYLQKRAEKIQQELTIAHNKEPDEHGDLVTHDQANFVLQENINDLLYENRTLEKYVRSENFRIYDETIGTLKFNLEELRSKLDKFRAVRKDLETSAKDKTKVLHKLQRKVEREGNKHKHN